MPSSLCEKINLQSTNAFPIRLFYPILVDIIAICMIRWYADSLVRCFAHDIKHQFYC